MFRDYNFGKVLLLIFIIPVLQRWSDGLQQMASEVDSAADDEVELNDIKSQQEDHNDDIRLLQKPLAAPQVTPAYTQLSECLANKSSY